MHSEGEQRILKHKDPKTPQSVVLYATIKVYLAAVKNLHIEFGCSLDFTSMPLLFKTLQGLKCLQSISKWACYPITITVLQLIYFKLCLSCEW